MRYLAWPSGLKGQRVALTVTLLKNMIAQKVTKKLCVEFGQLNNSCQNKPCQVYDSP